jgi:predicted aldo/keto reductase-like oxidoreductase
MVKHGLAVTIVRPVQEGETFWLSNAAGSILDDTSSAEVLVYAFRYAAPVRAPAVSFVIEVDRPLFC